MQPISWLKMRGYAIIVLAERNEALQEEFTPHPKASRGKFSSPLQIAGLGC